jgi:hypothetical protein
MMRLAGQAQYRRSRLNSNVRHRSSHRGPRPPVEIPLPCRTSFSLTQCSCCTSASSCSSWEVWSSWSRATGSGGGGVNRWWFRLAHLAAIAIVVAQAWLGQLCPLTTLESWLRVQAGESGYMKSFIEHWLQRIIFYEAPFWLFALAYTVFAVFVIAAWWHFPPTRRRHRNDA